MAPLISPLMNVHGDLIGDHVGVGQVGGILQALVLGPEEVQAQLVTVHDLGVREIAPTRQIRFLRPCGPSFMAALVRKR